MRVFLTGGTGFIGGHVLRRLAERGHEVTCLVRPGSVRAIQSLQLRGVQAIEGQFTRPETWRHAVAGHDAVINAVGIIRQTRRAGFGDVHDRAPRALWEAAHTAGVQKIVQISALGTDAKGVSAYFRSKAAADDALAAQEVPYVIFRPSFVYGPGDHSMTFFQTLAALPITPVPGDGNYLVQPLHVDDLARAVVAAVERADLRPETIAVGGAQAVPFAHLLDLLARRLGKPKARLWHVPWRVMGWIARLTDLLGKGPITRDELAMLRQGSACDITDFVARFGFEPVGCEAGLARTTLTQADRWHARLFHLRALLRLAIAFIWLATGVICATLAQPQSYELLRQVGITGALAHTALFGTCALEILLGLATAAGYKVRWCGMAQIALMLGFMAILTFRLPHYWIEPFGPLTKNIPLLAATLVMMAWEET